MSELNVPASVSVTNLEVTHLCSMLFGGSPSLSCVASGINSLQFALTVTLDAPQRLYRAVHGTTTDEDTDDDWRSAATGRQRSPTLPIIYAPQSYSSSSNAHFMYVRAISPTRNFLFTLQTMSIILVSNYSNQSINLR